MKKKKKKPTCMITDCGRVGYSRGLCGPCYQSSRLRIEAGDTTDEELVRLGIMLPRFAKARSPFRLGLENARRAQD